LRAIAWVFGVSTYPGAIRHSVVSGLAPRWAAKRPQSRSLCSIRQTAVPDFGAASQPSAGQARSPQKACSPRSCAPVVLQPSRAWHFSHPWDSPQKP